MVRSYQRGDNVGIYVHASGGSRSVHVVDAVECSYIWGYSTIKEGADQQGQTRRRFSTCSEP
jgi:hypothetical protein